MACWLYMMHISVDVDSLGFQGVRPMQPARGQPERFNTDEVNTWRRISNPLDTKNRKYIWCLFQKHMKDSNGAALKLKIKRKVVKATSKAFKIHEEELLTNIYEVLKWFFAINSTVCLILMDSNNDKNIDLYAIITIWTRSFELVYDWDPISRHHQIDFSSTKCKPTFPSKQLKAWCSYFLKKPNYSLTSIISKDFLGVTVAIWFPWQG